ncbi:DNA lyase [Archaeoglobales archaeon]|nr:MAG: DNA lyase [Archaeoglobales archaeon]
MRTNTQIQKIIENRIREFEILGNSGTVIFDFLPFLNLKIKATVENELVFCISTANSSAVAGLYLQKLLENVNLKTIDHEKIEEYLKKVGVRFYKRKALYVEKAITNFDVIEKILEMKDKKARERLVKTVKGFGYKEASHFLRNVGRKDLAIIDRHILKWLHENDLINEIPKSLTGKKYVKIEKILGELSLEKNMSLAELDLYLWYEMTGKILK